MSTNAVPTPLFDFTTASDETMGTPVAVGELGIGANIRGVGSGTERTAAGKQPDLVIQRPAGDGAITVYGADLPDPLSGSPEGNAFVTASASTSRVLQTAVALAAASSATLATLYGAAVTVLNATATTAGQPCLMTTGVPTHLHIVVLNGTILRCSASPAATEYTFTVTAGVITIYTGASVTIPVADANGRGGFEIVEYYVAAPTQILAAGLHSTEYTNIRSRTVIFHTIETAVTAGRTLGVLVPSTGA